MFYFRRAAQGIGKPKGSRGPIGDPCRGSENAARRPEPPRLRPHGAILTFPTQCLTRAFPLVTIRCVPTETKLGLFLTLNQICR